MCDNHITKSALADSMKKLMNEIPMKKISISQIVGACNMNRQSFYYHFKDKYDLVNWIYYTEFIITIQDSDLGKFEFLERACKYFYENKNFYQNAFQVSCQNCFSEYFSETTQNILKKQLEESFKNKKYVDFYVVFYAEAIQVSIARWLREGVKIPHDDFVQLLKNAVFKFADYIID